MAAAEEVEEGEAAMAVVAVDDDDDDDDEEDWSDEGDAEGAVVCDDEWERIDGRCCISLAPLVDPARGEGCTHAARCNFVALQQLCRKETGLGRVPRCPVVGCTAELARYRHCLVRDDELRSLLLGHDAPILWRSRTSGRIATASATQARDVIEIDDA